MIVTASWRSHFGHERGIVGALDGQPRRGFALRASPAQIIYRNDVQWSWSAWVLSVVAVTASAAVAWRERNFSRRPGLDMGFVNHGGMWGDLVLLPVANAVIVPFLAPGSWIVAALAIAFVLSVWVHVHWYRGDPRVRGAQPPMHSCEHMWPSRPHGSWWRDLSWAGWAHVFYVAAELTILMGFFLFPMPLAVVAMVCAVFTLHVPLGLLQPHWYLTGGIASLRQQPLLVPLLAMLWLVGLVKM
jgi:hypothetical protein